MDVQKRKSNVFFIYKFIITFYALVSPSSPSALKDENETFDFVIVGAGAAGCVVASRLSSEKFNVVLIETGGDPDPDLDIPAKASRATNKENSKVYITATESSAGLQKDGKVSYKVGMTLGGGTAVNGMMYNRGNEFDYDNWANITGDPSWSYTNMLKHFKNIEDFQDSYPLEEYHSNGGPVTISSLEYAPGLDTWLEAGHFFGYPNSDPNGRQKMSFTSIQSSRLAGRRISSYHGYISPVLSTTPNLKVIKNAKVTRILFQGNKAIGVKYVTKEGHEAAISVLKEVIVSCGAIGSPVLLMKSGIGPKDVLENVGIPAIKYLPVGRNFHDHALLFLSFLVEKDKVHVFDARRELTEEAFRQYEKTGEGPYSCYNGVTAQAFLLSAVRAREPAPNPEWPDIHVMLFQNPIDFGSGSAVDEKDITISTLVGLTRPKSRGGWITLNSTNVEADPLISFQYFSHPNDMEAMVDGLKKIVHVFENAPSYKVQGARYSTVPLKYCKHLDFRSDEYWKCYVMYMAGSGNHGAGSCRMGSSDDDPEAVVTSDLKVIGIENVRVADTSIMPVVTNANTQAGAYVIGEKAADYLIKDWTENN